VKETHFFIVSGVNFHVGIASALIGESQRAELAIVRLDALKKILMKFKFHLTLMYSPFPPLFRDH
jgi:hypothetical protein